MKWLLCALIFETAYLFDASSQTISRLPADTNTVSFQSRNGDKVTVSVRHLLYKDEDGAVGPTAESYVFEVIDRDYPIIVDGIYGDHLSFELSNIGGTNGQDLLVFYHSGGNQFGVKIYTIDGVGISPLKTQPVSSNMGYIQLKGKEIIIKNQEFKIDSSTTHATLYTDTYQVVSNECKLLKEQKEILPPDTQN